jgi:hypothetical protein
MTLCMAAACYDLENDKNYVMTAADRRAEVDWAGGDVAYKYGFAKKGWPALFAGELSKAEDFLATSRAYFKQDGEPLTPDNVLDKFNEVSSLHKEKLCRRWVRQRFGISFERFLVQGNGELPQDVRARAFHEIAQLDFGCDVITFGFIPMERRPGEMVGVPFIIEIDKYGEVHFQQNFAAIGTGSPIALSVLYQREQASYRAPEETLYHLYEASRLASATAPGVGDIDEFVAYADSESEGEDLVATMSLPSVINELKKAFDAYGPKPMLSLTKFVIDGALIRVARPEKKQTRKPKGQPSDSQKSGGQP